MSRQTLTRQDVEQVWRGRVEAWRKSGLSQRAFCEKNELALSTLQLWLRRLKSQESRSSAGVEIVPVSPLSLSQIQPVRPQSPAIVVVMGGGQYRVEITDGFHPTTLQEVVRALEGRG